MTPTDMIPRLIIGTRRSKGTPMKLYPIPLGLTALILTASACSSGTSPQTGAAQNSPPAASADHPSVQPAAVQPQAQGDVTTDETVFRLQVGAVKAAHSYTDGFHQAQIASAGNQLIVVTVDEKNIGVKPGNLEMGTPSPMTLNAADGKTFTTSVTWSDPSPVNPGLTQKDAYVFETPTGEIAKTLTVTLATGGDDGTRPAAVLQMPAA